MRSHTSAAAVGRQRLFSTLPCPAWTAFQLRRALSADPRWADIPVIVYTANPHLRVPDVIGVFRKGTDDPNRLLEMLAVACKLDSEPSRSH